MCNRKLKMVVNITHILRNTNIIECGNLNPEETTLSYGKIKETGNNLPKCQN